MGLLKLLFYLFILFIIIIVGIIVLPVPVLNAITKAFSILANMISSKINAVSQYNSNSVKTANSVPAKAVVVPPNFTTPNQSTAPHKPKNIIINTS